MLQVDAYTSSSTALWQWQRLVAVNGEVALTVPSYAVSTVVFTRVNVIPEPGHVAMLGAVTAGTLTRRRRVR
jgi:hypothetical protein